MNEVPWKKPSILQCSKNQFESYKEYGSQFDMRFVIIFYDTIGALSKTLNCHPMVYEISLLLEEGIEQIIGTTKIHFD